MPTYKRATSIEHAIRPLLDDPATHEVVVVVDGSPDDTLERVEAIARQDGRVRPLAIENRGAPGARQAGAEAATGDILLVMDDDVIAEPGLVSGHQRRQAEARHRVVLGYMPINLPEVRSADDFATRIYAAEYERRCREYERSPDSVLSHLWAGNFSIPRDDCLAVGLSSDEYFEWYHADRDFGLRCKEHGLTAVFDPALRAEHRHGRTLDGFLRDARTQGVDHMLLHNLHAAALGPLPGDAFERGLPWPARAVVRLTRRPRSRALVRRGLELALRAAGAARLWSAQEISAKLLRRVYQQQGALDYAAGRHGPGGA
jgi:glycosyltransferase involved in cell wall biosynthesis